MTCYRISGKTLFSFILPFYAIINLKGTENKNTFSNILLRLPIYTFN